MKRRIVVSHLQSKNDCLTIANVYPNLTGGRQSCGGVLSAGQRWQPQQPRQQQEQLQSLVQSGGGGKERHTEEWDPASGRGLISPHTEPCSLSTTNLTSKSHHPPPVQSRLRAKRCWPDRRLLYPHPPSPNKVGKDWSLRLVSMHVTVPCIQIVCVIGHMAIT